MATKISNMWSFWTPCLQVRPTWRGVRSQRHVTSKDQGRDPNIFEVSYLRKLFKTDQNGKMHTPRLLTSHDANMSRSWSPNIEVPYRKVFTPSTMTDDIT